jgi:putative ABC transport system ATP-binding protein
MASAGAASIGAVGGEKDGDSSAFADDVLATITAEAEERDRIEKQLDAPPTSDELIKLRNVHKTYLLGVEGVPAVRGVNLTVRRGEFLVILGKSGGGKSTMLNLMTTIDRPSRGDVWLCGTRIREATPDAELAAIRLQRIGFVFQSFNLVPSMSAIENVELPMVLAGFGTAADRRKRATELLQRVGMGHRLEYMPSQLSGGEAQRVAISRALANRPDILVGDEITGDLDPANTAIVMSILLDLNRVHGVTVVMVTHEVSLKMHAHRVVHMLDGRISRLEVVPTDVREAADAAVRGHDAVLAADARHGGSAASMLTADHGAGASAGKAVSAAGAGSSGSSSSSSGSMRRRVMVRRPGDYPTHRFAVDQYRKRREASAEATVGDTTDPARPATASSVRLA